MEKPSFSQKILICVVIFGFGLFTLFMSSASENEFSREMKEYASKGVRVTASRASKLERKDGLNRTYFESTYEFEIAGKTHRHVENSYPQWDSNPPGDTEVLTYLPESPFIFKSGVPDWEQNQKSSMLVSAGFMAVGALLFAITLARRGLNQRKREDIEAESQLSDREGRDREFNSRSPIQLLVWAPILQAWATEAAERRLAT